MSTSTAHVNVWDQTPEGYTGRVFFLAQGANQYESTEVLGLFQDLDQAIATAANASLDSVWVDILPLNVAL